MNCIACGKEMKQTSEKCYECMKCGESVTENIAHSADGEHVARVWMSDETRRSLRSDDPRVAGSSTPPMGRRSFENG
jgi:tRNA(Ile2) C34 agmatinyltransferase TiaS